VDVATRGEQSGIPAQLAATVTDDDGARTLDRLVQGTT